MPRRPSPAPFPSLLAVVLLALTTLAACAQTSGAPLATESPTSPPASPTPTVRPAITPGPPAPTRIAPLTGLVPERTFAFVSDRGGQVDLWLLDIGVREGGGYRTRRLTNDEAIESFPIWSPDGSILAYVVEDERAHRNLWLLDLRTGVHRQLTREEPPFDVRRAVWLRGGRALIYDTGKPFDRRPELRVITVYGEQLAPLLPAGDSVIFDWSTDGTTVICAVAPPLGVPRIVVAEAVPGAALLPDTEAPVGFAVELGPDGRYATFSAPPFSDDQSTWVLDLATGRTGALNAAINSKETGREKYAKRYDHDFAWAPDGRRLAYVHGTGGVTDGQGRLKVTPGLPPTADGFVGISTIELADIGNRLEGVGYVRLTSGSADAAPRWSPDGRWIAYLSDTQRPTPDQSNIWIVAADGGEPPDNLTQDVGNNWSPAWMPLPGAARGR